MKKKIFAALMKFLLVFPPVIQLAVGGSVAIAATETWTDITGAGGFSYPQGVAVDSSDNVYVTDYSNNTLNKLSAGNSTWTDITGTGSFSGPQGVAVDSSDNVYVVDNNKILVLQAVNSVSVSPGSASVMQGDSQQLAATVKAVGGREA